MNYEEWSDGVGQFVITCDDDWRDDSEPITYSKYFVINIEIDAVAKTWKVATDNPVDKAPSTTSAAVSAVTATSATLTASITPTAATGKVQFTQNGADIPGAEATLSGGTATYGVSGLTPSTSYTFGARYLGDDKHDPSTGTASTITTGSVADSSESTIGVEIPAETSTEPSGLKIAVKPQGVSLSGAASREKDAEWQATGSLGNVTVNDDRRVQGAKWALNGEASAFLTAEKASLPASNLGWEPKLDGSGGGTAGATVAPGTDGGLSQPKVLASGLGAATPNVTTKVTAGLTLKVPAGTPGGNYSSTLTLTLI